MMIFKRVIILVIALSLIFSGVNIAEDNTITEVQTKLEGVSFEEKAILESLFLITQDIENLEKKEVSISQEIDDANYRIVELEKAIEKEQLNYNEHLDRLALTLKQYQKKGSTSYFELIISSKDLKTFVRKLNILRDYSSSNKKLVDDIEASKAVLDIAKNEQILEREKLQMAKESLKATIESKLESKALLESALVNLQDQRGKYEAYLKEIQKNWDALKPLFKKTVDEFSRLVVSGNLPYDAMKLEFSIFGIKGTLPESAFNSVIKAQKNLPELKFEFFDGYMILSIPEKKVTLNGEFEIVDGNKLRYVVTSGTFYGLSLEAESIEDLFSDGYMSLDLTYLLEGFKIDTVTLKKGNLELLVKP